MREEMVAEASALLKEHAELGPLFALKDPRLCRLADVWLEAMHDAQIDPLVVIMVRNPLEVAESLESRDLMSHGYGLLLWLRHVIDAERLSRGQRRVVCTYDQLLENWHDAVGRIKSGLGVSFPRNSPVVHREIDDFLSPSHRHHRLAVETVLRNSGLSDWLRKALAVMLRWSEVGESEEDHRELDAIAAEFDNSYSAFARLLLLSDAAGEVGSASHLKRQLSAQIQEAQHASIAAQAAIKDAEDKLENERRRLAELETEIESLRTVQPQLNAEIAELKAALDSSGGKVDELEAEVERLENERRRLAELETEIESLRTVQPQLNAEIAELKAALDSSGGKVDELEAEVERLENERRRAEELEFEIKLMRERDASASREIAKLEKALEDSANLVRKEEERRREAEKVVESQRSNLAQSEWKVSEYQGRLATAQSALIQREEELAQLWKQLLEAEKTTAYAKATSDHERERATAAERKAAELAQQVDELKSASALSIENLSAEVALMTQLLRDQNTAAEAAEEELLALKHQLRDRERMLKEAQEGLAEASAKQHEMSFESKALWSKVVEAEKQKLDAETARAAAERKLSSRSDELTRLTRALSDVTERSSLSQAQATWLREVVVVSRSFPKWWSIMPTKWRRKREEIRYRRRGLFDPDRYLANNPDVAEFGMDPMVHYIVHGMEEGRTWER
ncbi:hypothetical protein CBR61_01685 [Porphyrobacter sp. CACIAM 03H1]|nr:hypothetical protein CBR61_01685 [Porphyrobacter sp. CACIAM 03H1]